MNRNVLLAEIENIYYFYRNEISNNDKKGITISIQSNRQNQKFKILQLDYLCIVCLINIHADNFSKNEFLEVIGLDIKQKQLEERIPIRNIRSIGFVECKL